MSSPASEPIVERHWPRIEGLVPRTEGDRSPEALRAQTRARMVLQVQRDVGPVAPRLLSTSHGRIDRLLLTIPAYAVDDVGGAPNPLRAAYEDLVAKLPTEVGYTVLTHESVEPTVREWFSVSGRTVELIAMPDHLHFSVWAEDGYVVVKDDLGRTFLVEPFEFPRYADGLIADAVSNGSDLSHTQAPLYFQGGNVLIGDDFFLIGADYPANSLDYVGRAVLPAPGESPAEAIHRLYGEYLDQSRTLHYVASTIPVPAQEERDVVIDGEQWTELLYFGNKPGTVQPLFHIDMLMTLAGRDDAGRYQVLVGDPRLAADILGVPVWPQSMPEVFDNIAAGMERLGFVVHRNPLPLVHVDDPQARRRVWYFATANNALVQIDDDGDRRVWLPAYGFGAWTSLAATDEANVEAWRALGFEATLLTDFHPFAENLGAVHCIKKYLARA